MSALIEFDEVCKYYQTVSYTHLTLPTKIAV